MKAYGLCRLGRDAELRVTQSGESVATLSLAFSYGRRGEEGVRPTQWVDASLWGRRAEALLPYLKKGSLLLASLEDVHMESYEGRNGPGHKLAARVVDVEFAGTSDRPAERASERSAMTASHDGPEPPAWTPVGQPAPRPSSFHRDPHTDELPPF